MAASWSVPEGGPYPFPPDPPRVGLARQVQAITADHLPWPLEYISHVPFMRRMVDIAGAKFVGKATPEQWADTVKILADTNILPAGTPATSYYTYDFLPAEAQLRKCPLN